MKYALAILIFGPFLLPSANAATVELSDGRRIQAELINHNDFAYVLKMSGREIQIPTSMVLNIFDKADTDAAAAAPGEIRMLPASGGAPVVFGDAAAAPHAEPPVAARAPMKAKAEPCAVEGEEEDLSVHIPQPRDQALLNDLMVELNQLRYNDPIDFIAARQLVASAGDEGLGFIATNGLYHDSPIVRTRSAQLLGELGGKRTLGVLIQAFFAAAHPTIAPFQVDFVQELTAQISRLTGVDFGFQPRYGTEAPLVAGRMIDWWRANYAQLPQQLGEPALDRDDPEYLAKVGTLRNLPLQRREFAGFNLPPDIVVPAGPATQAEIEFASSVPTIPRDLTLERNTSSSQTPSSFKGGYTGLTPGDYRRDLYLDRMLGEVRAGNTRYGVETGINVGTGPGAGTGSR